MQTEEIKNEEIVDVTTETTENVETDVQQEEKPKVSFTEIPDGKTIEDIKEVVKEEEKQEVETPSNLDYDKEVFTEYKDDDDDLEFEELNDETAFKYLKQSKGFEFDSLEEFLASKQEITSKQLPPEIEKFLEFQEQTGRDYKDFLELQKDWSQESDDSLIKQYIKAKNPLYDNEDIEDEIQDRFSYDEEEDSDRDIRQKKRDLKTTKAEALDYFNNLKEKYNVPLGADELKIPEDYKVAKTTLDDLVQKQVEYESQIKSQTDFFTQKTNELFSKEFEGFKSKIGDETLILKPTDINSVKKNQLDLNNFMSKFVDDKGMAKDVENYHKALYFAMNPDEVAKHFYELGKANQAETIEKKSKNIDMNNRQSYSAPSSTMRMTILED